MNGYDFIEKLKELEVPVFSIATASNIIQKPVPYTRLYINRLYRGGAIKRIEHGRYCIPGTDEYTIASRIIPNSYITGYGALEHYDLTTQITTKLQVVSGRYHRRLKLANFTVEFSRVKKEFVYGYVTMSNGPVFAEPEKVFIDDLYLHGRQYYSEEFSYALSNNKLDFEKLKKYALASKNNALIRRFTKLLEPWVIPDLPHGSIPKGRKGKKI